MRCAMTSSDGSRGLWHSEQHTPNNVQSLQGCLGRRVECWMLFVQIKLNNNDERASMGLSGGINLVTEAKLTVHWYTRDRWYQQTTKKKLYELSFSLSSRHNGTIGRFSSSQFSRACAHSTNVCNLHLRHVLLALSERSLASRNRCRSNVKISILTCSPTFFSSSHSPFIRALVYDSRINGSLLNLLISLWLVHGHTSRVSEARKWIQIRGGIKLQFFRISTVVPWDISHRAIVGIITAVKWLIFHQDLEFSEPLIEFDKICDGKILFSIISVQLEHSFLAITLCWWARNNVLFCQVLGFSRQHIIVLPDTVRFCR